MNRPQRLLSMLVVLRARSRVTAAELAEEFGVSERTVLRDVETLAAADLPVVAERGRYGGIVMLPGRQTDLNRLNASEVDV
ncbi:helix-turn-helix transcriptional regulator, partial [Rhodococcus opacus]